MFRARYGTLTFVVSRRDQNMWGLRSSAKRPRPPPEGRAARGRPGNVWQDYPTCCPLVHFPHIREHDRRCCARRAMRAWQLARHLSDPHLQKRFKIAGGCARRTILYLLLYLYWLAPMDCRTGLRGSSLRFSLSSMLTTKPRDPR